MASRGEIKRWLLQLKLRPRLLLLGFVSNAVQTLLTDLGVTHDSVRNPRVELAEIWRRVSKCQAIVLMADFDDVHRIRVQDAFAHVGVTSIDEANSEEEVLLTVLESMIIASVPQSDRKPNEKDQRTPGHHMPRQYPQYNSLCQAICQLPQVTRIRYFKYAGRDLEVVRWPEDPADGNSKIDLRVRTTDRCGVVVSIVCDHPVHLDSARRDIEDLLAHHSS